MAFQVNRLNRFARSLFFPCMVLMAVSPVFAQDSMEISSTPSQDRPTLTRAINIDEASVSSSIYVSGSIENNFSQGHQISLEGEGIFRLARDWGLDVVFPQVTLDDPIGQGAAMLGPIGGGFRYVFARFRNRMADSAGVFSLEAQGFYWATPNSQFPGEGSNYVLQGLAGMRFGHWTVQGNYGYNGAIDQAYQPNWFAFSSLGYALAAHWALQIEADYTGDVLPSDGGLDSQWVLVPQLGFKTDGWLFEAGEAFNPSQAGSSTDFIIQKNLF
jgi:hypothetical protein